MPDVRTWGWYQPGLLPGWDINNQNNLDGSMNGTVLNVADYREYFLRDLDGDGVVFDTDTDDGSSPNPPDEGVVVDGLEFDAHEIALYDNSTITVSGVDYTVRLVATVLDNGAWGVRILDADIQPGWYPADITAAQLGTWNGVEYSGTNTSSVDQMLCFTAETPIHTPTGWRPAGALRAGDLVTTHRGAEPLIWTARQTVDARRRARAPVTLPAGTLGSHGVIRLSPLHRILIATPETSLLFGHHRVLVAAKHLRALPGVVQHPEPQVTYVHLMTQKHSLLRSAGLWCESFQAGVWAQRLLPVQEREHLLQLLPNPMGLKTAYPVLTGRDSRVLLHMMEQTSTPPLRRSA